jgi:hypothetical protein
LKELRDAIEGKSTQSGEGTSHENEKENTEFDISNEYYVQKVVLI